MPPTCNHCGAKFPGHAVCGVCGQDPNSVATDETRTHVRVRRATQQIIASNGTLSKGTKRARMRSAKQVPKKKKHGR